MLKYFPIFKSVYETLNFSRSAKELFVSQSTISQQIKQLETSLGVTLFLRNGKREIKPTLAADELYQSGLKIWDDLQNLESHISQLDSEIIDCHIGVSNTIAETMIAKVFQQIHVPKNINLIIKMSNSTEIVKKLNQHSFDFGFIEKPITTPGIKRLAFFQDQLVHAGNFSQQTWLKREAGSGVRHFTDQYLRLNNITPQQTFTLESNEMILKFLQLGLGQTIASKSIIKEKIPYEEIGSQFTRDFYFLSQRSYQSDALNQLNHQLESTLNQIKKEQYEG